MRVTEIFFSIWASSHAGKPCIFVRLTGCSLRCVYCDTKYSYAGGHEMTLTEVRRASKATHETGGTHRWRTSEQEEAYPLMDSSERGIR
jgi:organic radical activating enzyme